MTELNTKIVACGETFDIGHRVVLWNEPGGLNHYLTNKTSRIATDKKTGKKFTKVITGPRYTPGTETSLAELQLRVSMFVVHHSATYRAGDTYKALQDVRKLSCVFYIDDDPEATIYQSLDMKDAGWSHGPYNEHGPGVEICYQPAAWADPNFYSEAIRKKLGVQEHPKMVDTLRGQKLTVFGPTEAQVRACEALLWGVCSLFPRVRPEFPKESDGSIMKTHLSKPELHEGLVGHFHLTARKVDPLGFPFEEVEKNVQARLKYGF